MLDLGPEVVKAVYIFNKRNGRPFIRYVKNKQDFAVESFLVIGFLTAILKFSREVGKTDLKMIDMEDLRFVFTQRDDIVFTAICATTVNPLDLLFKITTIESIFLNDFTQEELFDSRLELEYFNRFIPIVDEIIQGDIRFIEPENKQKIIQELEKFRSYHEKISGLAILSFTGDILIDVLIRDVCRTAVKSLFNTVFGIRLTGISQVLIDFTTPEKYSIFIKQIEEETLLAVIAESERDIREHHDKIEKLIKDVDQILSRRSNNLPPNS